MAEVYRLLEKFRVESHLVEISSQRKPDLERVLTERQQDAELERHLARHHVADLAELLESLPAEERLRVWMSTPARRRGDILLELSDAVRAGIIDSMSQSQLIDALRYLDADDLAYLSDAIPDELLRKITSELDSDGRSRVHRAKAYASDRVGHLMSSEPLIVQPVQTLASIQALLRSSGELPFNTDKIFVADHRGHLCGVLFLQDILLHDPEIRVQAVMKENVVSFNPGDSLDEVARAFERYDLVSAPVINERGKIVGRLTVDTVMDYVREASEMDALNVAGVVGSEDLFDTVWSSARNRWLWLGINLFTAFVISRIIGSFEATISKLVALASLMPIVTSVAGNTGNQTAALVIRSLALDQINSGNLRHLLRKELVIALLNGAVWGSVVGLFAYMFYAQLSLALVVMLAMFLGFMLAAVIGVAAPVILGRIGRDPAMGSSVILTGLTDALGFLIFLVLATIFLV